MFLAVLCLSWLSSSLDKLQQEVDFGQDLHAHALLLLCSKACTQGTLVPSTVEIQWLRPVMERLWYVSLPRHFKNLVPERLNASAPYNPPTTREENF